MKKPKLAVMAAGMGSRYGGLKQIDPVTKAGEIIIDFSLHDAMLAGFSDVVFIIKKEIEEDVRALIDERAGKVLNISYAYQEIGDLPGGFTPPPGREKPWGTCHALLAAKELLDAPFAVINADDYYGKHSFKLIYDKLAAGGAPHRYALVGYTLENTVTEYGTVARGVCEVAADGTLASINERLGIEWSEGQLVYSDEEGRKNPLDPKATVSMNMWGLTPAFLEEAERGFPGFLEQALAGPAPLKSEYLLPVKIDELIKEGTADTEVLPTDDVWYGVTYREDKPKVAAALQALKDRGFYPETLWK